MRIYLAGYETSYSAYQLEVQPNANLFLTYFYSRLTERGLTFLKNNNHKGLITIDSGAHSFFSILNVSVAGQRTKDTEIPEAEKYFEAYLDWALKWHEHFDYFCELDIQELIGQASVSRWRERTNEAGLGHKLITVHHSYNSWDDFVHLCETSQSKYIAIEGIRKGKKVLDYNKYLKYAYEHGIKVHGFAFTRLNLLNHYPFYSVDSSSWTMCTRYGKIHVWDNESCSLKVCDPKMEHFANMNIPIELNSDARTKEDCKAKLQFNATAYYKMQDYLTKLWDMRGIKWQEN